MPSPASIPELLDAVHSSARLLAVGARTKPRLSEAPDTDLIDLRRLSGITEYQASEYTITARAGTTLAELNQALAAKGQYLPFDPPLVDAGATLGGTIAANLSGPGRIRFGGVRDFVLGLTWIDGQGQLLHGGGKVVKNAAGFDTPKLMVGSLGRLGIITEVTLKVFPRPPAPLTLRLPCETHGAALHRLAALTIGRYELDALDYLPADRTLLVRLAGPADSNSALAREIGGTPVPGESVWPSLNTFAWAPPDHALIKIPTTPGTACALLTDLAEIPRCRPHLTAGGNLIWVSVPDTAALHRQLSALHVTGLVIRGPSPSLYLGLARSSTLESTLYRTFDPHQKFGPRH